MSARVFGSPLGPAGASAGFARRTRVGLSRGLLLSFPFPPPRQPWLGLVGRVVVFSSMCFSHMEATFSVNSCTTRSSSDHWKSPAFDGAQLRPLDKVEEYLAVIVGVLFVGKHQPATLASLRPSGFVFGGALLGSIARGILGSRATVPVIIL